MTNQGATYTGDTQEDKVMRALLPVGRSGLAIAAGYVALLSLFLLPAPFALALGIAAVMDIRKNPEKHGMGRAVFAIIVGGLFTALIIVMVISKLLA